MTRLGDDPTLVAERQRRLAALGPRPPWYRFSARRFYDAKLRGIMAMDVSAFGAMLRTVYLPEMAVAMAQKERVEFLSTPIAKTRRLK